MFSKIGAGLLLASVLFGSNADAAGRFGRRSDNNAPAGNTSSSSSSSSGTHSTSSVGGSSNNNSNNTSSVAPAEPVRGHGHVRVRPYYRQRYYTHGYYSVYPYYVAPPVYVDDTPRYAPQYVAPAPQQEVSTVENAREGRVAVGFEGHFFNQGGNVGATAAFEERHWGFIAQGYQWGLRPLDGSAGLDTMQTASARLTYALLSGPEGRLRVEAGADVANTPDVLMVGPTVGVSGLLNVSILSLEASATWTPLPYQQLDLRAGVGVELGILQLRAGYRAQLLSDNGLVDGVDHTELFSGPYAGIGLIF